MTGFLDLELPERFVLEGQDHEGDWLDLGLFEASAFARTGDGIYVCAGHGGSPVILRCVSVAGPRFDALDGSGQRHRYRLIALPDPRYPTGD